MNQTKTPLFTTPGPSIQPQSETQRLVPNTNKHEDDAKLLFGVVYSLRNITRKLSSPYSLPRNSNKGTIILFPIALQSINYIITRLLPC